MTQEDLAPNRSGGKKKIKKSKKNQGGSKPKPKAKSKNRGRVELYAMPYSSGYKTVDNQIDSSVVYSKTATGAFEIKLKDVKLRNQDPNSYDLFFLEPGYGRTKSDDTLCQILGGEVIFTNPSPAELTLRVQRPMGFKDDLSAVAMWEPLQGKLMHSVAPEKTLTLKIPVHNTDHMTMREEVIHGYRGAHLFSISLFREPYSRSGESNVKVDERQIGLIVEVILRFKSADGEIGQEELFCVCPFNSSNRLNYTTSGPMPSLRVADIFVDGGNAVMALASTATDPKNKQCLAVRFKRDGGQPYTECSLDNNTIYRMDCIFILQSGGTKMVCRFLKHENSEWIVGDLNQNVQPSFVPGKVLNDFFIPNLNIEDMLYPVSRLPAVKTSRFVYPIRKGSMGIRCYRAGHYSYKELKNLEVESLSSTLIEALVIVYNVSKVAIELLGVIGVLDNPDVGVRRTNITPA